MSDICYYCQKNKPETTVFGKPICSDCHSMDIRTTAPLHRMDDEQKAFALKLAVYLFRN